MEPKSHAAADAAPRAPGGGGPISFEEARRTVLDRVPAPSRTEEVAAEDAVGRVLAEELVADADAPPFDRSTMDGFAVRASDLGSGGGDLRIVDFVPAGSASRRRLGPGEAARIMTGAPLPDGADAVVRLEDAVARGPSPVGGEVAIAGPVARGTHVRPRGEDAGLGAVLASPGRRLTPLDVAVAASVGRPRLRVVARPRVRVLATGDELVPADASPGPARIRDSNGPMVAALARESGARVAGVARAGDDPPELERAVAEGLESDVLVVTGGVSVGDRDLVADAVARAGGRTVFHRVAMKPGRHALFAIAGSTLVFGLPGNPVSACIGFRVFVRPVLDRLRGLDPSTDLPVVGIAGAAMRGSPHATVFIPASWQGGGGGGARRAVPIRTGGSGDPFGAARADVFVRVPPGATIEVGDSVDGIGTAEP